MWLTALLGVVLCPLCCNRAGRRIFAVASPGIMLAYAVWLLDDYAATALDGIVSPPAVLDSIGIWGYRHPFPALLPLLLHLLTTLAIAGLSRNQLAVHAGGVAAVPAADGSTGQESVDAAGPGVQSAGGADGRASTDEGRGRAIPSPGIAIPGVEAQGGSPIASARRELRQIVSFGGRLSYTEGTYLDASLQPSMLGVFCFSCWACTAPHATFTLFSLFDVPSSTANQQGGSYGMQPC
jgi:hypothetical protein